ncbi:hypothetical protein RXV86_03255 [Alisedimentitalea sp. MJ-SS2]|uniref:hypothetical protein n=1 Tax=Aliisedimentitalea sp. MJ-SS2 TaxID=3049795 RepID=UPI00290739FB|nr:hypothetical protein [Alisedimentitalea sp. MJ-SS2]MDU8926394.1 hypothetical protein [Alisedimentitalea sp. MJ-SS2]
MKSTVAVLALVLAPLASALEAQTLVGSNVDSRVLLGLSTDAEALQARMPDGWTAIAFPKGPMKGANMLIGFEDRAVALDAEGKPLTPSVSKGVALLALAKETDGKGIRLYVMRVYSTAPDLLPYGNAMAADITRATTRDDGADGKQARTDHWVAMMADGKLELKLGFTTGRRGWSPSKAKLYSTADPTVIRIFDYQQMVDVQQSDGLGKPMAGTIELTNSIADAADLLGTAKVVAVLDIPVYVRKVFKP